MMMEEYKMRPGDDNRSGPVPPEILTATIFEIKGPNLSMLMNIPFSRQNYEDAFKHIDEVLDISNYFHVPKFSRDVVLLTMLLVTFIGDAKTNGFFRLYKKKLMWRKNS